MHQISTQGDGGMGTAEQATEEKRNARENHPLEDNRSTLRIRTAEKKFPVSQNLYGIFFEDINRAGDGGLYPEMIRNRSFEDSIPPASSKLDERHYALISPQGWKDQFNNGDPGMVCTGRHNLSRPDGHAQPEPGGVTCRVGTCRGGSDLQHRFCRYGI